MLCCFCQVLYVLIMYNLFLQQSLRYSMYICYLVILQYFSRDPKSVALSQAFVRWWQSPKTTTKTKTRARSKVLSLFGCKRQLCPQEHLESPSTRTARKCHTLPVFVTFTSGMRAQVAGCMGNVGVSHGGGRGAQALYQLFHKIMNFSLRVPLSPPKSR